MTVLTSPSFPVGLAGNRSEAEARAVRARRARLELDLLAEGASVATVRRLATDEVAANLLQHEGRIFDMVAKAFAPIGSGLR